MEKRDAVVLLLLASGAGYAIYDNWDAIASRLGIDKLEPGRLKAIELVKESEDLGDGLTNWQYVQSRKDLREIKVAMEPWVATPTGGQDYTVTLEWEQGERRVLQTFAVNIAQRTVDYRGAEETDL